VKPAQLAREAAAQPTSEKPAAVLSAPDGHLSRGIPQFPSRSIRANPDATIARYQRNVTRMAATAHYPQGITGEAASRRCAQKSNTTIPPSFSSHFAALA